MTKFPKIIKDGDIKLVKIAPTFENAWKIYDVIDSSRDFLRQWLTWVDTTTSPEVAFDHIKKSAEATNGNYHIIYDGNIVGAIGFDWSEKNNRAEVGYWLSQNYNGRGIMTRALRALEKFGFETLGLNRIEILVDAENTKSRAVAMRTGYVQEGTLRQSMMLYGRPRDMVMYSKLKSEWEKENKNA